MGMLGIYVAFGLFKGTTNESHSHALSYVRRTRPNAGVSDFVGFVLTNRTHVCLSVVLLSHFPSLSIRVVSLFSVGLSARRTLSRSFPPFAFPEQNTRHGCPRPSNRQPLKCAFIFLSLFFSSQLFEFGLCSQTHLLLFLRVWPCGMVHSSSHSYFCCVDRSSCVQCEPELRCVVVVNVRISFIYPATSHVFSFCSYVQYRTRIVCALLSCKSSAKFKNK
jgi:hypothetical protein